MVQILYQTLTIFQRKSTLYGFKFTTPKKYSPHHVTSYNLSMFPREKGSLVTPL